MLKQIIAFLALAVLLSACWDFRTRPQPGPRMVMGYKPVYSTDSSQFRVLTMGPQPVKNAGKIYVKDQLIFQNDLGWGIHVINNANPSSPSPLGFIRVLGNAEMSIKGNSMFVNSFADLVVLDISDWQNVVEVKRIPQAFHLGNNNHYYLPLPEHKVYFECPGYFNTKVQTGWVKDSVSTYNCYNP
jgi:hypothetical protein